MSGSLLCHRCGRELEPGRGDFFVVRIEAVADPTPPQITETDLQRDHRREFEATVDELSSFSERELMDQVIRRLTLHLCGPYYRAWIENPTGGG